MVAPAKLPGRPAVDRDLNTRLGTVIRQKRVLLGLSQEVLGKRLGVTFQQVQKYEKGTNQVTYARLVDLASVLGTSVGELAQASLAAEAPACEGISDRETLELMKRIAKLTPSQRKGVRLLVQSLAEEV